MISFGFNIFKIYLVYIRLVEIWSEYCICCVLICELEIHKTIILKRYGFSDGSGTDTFPRLLPNHSIDHHKWFTINMSFESWLGHLRRLDIFNGLWYNHVQNFGSPSWFWRCKEHPCPLSHHLGLWRTLELPDWGLASLSWFGYGHWYLTQPWSESWPCI